MSGAELSDLGATLDDTFFVIAGLVLAVELVLAASRKQLEGRTFLDMFASVSTQIPYLLVEVFVLSGVYVGYVLVSDAYIHWTLPLNAWTIFAALVACDFAYYWEHRLSHEVRLLWTQHAVHHSSRYMNVIVAIRFGPFEGVASGLIHLPLVLLGFPPELVFFGILTVLAYQGWLHTEYIGRLGILDEFLNTPSNHRVHHGSNPQYLDKNYGGISIVWDKLFGTYQPEVEPPRFGLKRDFESVNPLIVWTSEWPGLIRDLRSAAGTRECLRILFAHPDWITERHPAAAGHQSASAE
ncbi:MAG: sterol desaturase family protein [Pseudomonadota bacterium]